MTKNKTKIQWADYTFNPWRGCTKVSEGCRNCYAERDSKKAPGILGVWGDQGSRILASSKMWQEPLKWEAFAKMNGDRFRVFCASFADVFEDYKGPLRSSTGAIMGVCPVPETWSTCGGFWSMGYKCPGCLRPVREATLADARAELFRIIDATPSLDWLLLTKRPENVSRMLPEYQPGGIKYTFRTNVWLGVSIENQETAEKRLPILAGVPARIRWISAEPLLGPIDFESENIWGKICEHENGMVCRETGALECSACDSFGTLPEPAFDWVIVGGESGPKARPFSINWAESIIDQCRRAKIVSPFVKQLGAVPIGGDGKPYPFLSGFKNDDPELWPESIRVREFPA